MVSTSVGSSTDREAKEYGIIDAVIVTTRPDRPSAASDGRLGLAAGGGGKPKPRPEPEREGPKASL